MSPIHDYLELCKDISSVDELSLVTFKYLKNKKCDITLFRHILAAQPLKILETTNSYTLKEWSGYLTKISGKRSGTVISNQKYDYFFSNRNFLKDHVFLFAINRNHLTTKEILFAWQSLTAIYKTVYSLSKQEMENAYGNMISQFMHDIQSLIDASKSTDNEIIKRINYQKKLNKDLLFFIRDFDLFRTGILLKNFVYDSLELIGVGPDLIETDIENENMVLDIDVELFSQTFNVVVKNALKAAENDFTKIKIKIYSRPTGSPFLKFNWLVFEVSDYGNGIAVEFEPFVAKPFFTTHKHDGHTGFGLSNAQKIINAHNGFLEIITGKVTTVKIYLPQKNDEK